MRPRDSYPAGVPCWLSLTQDDPDRTLAFYGSLFGWTFERRTPPDAPETYSYAHLDGLRVAGVGGPAEPELGPGWTTYVCVDDLERTLKAAEAADGQVVQPAKDIPNAGRLAAIADPWGAVVGLWQPGGNPGAALVNAPGSWNFSELHLPDPEAAKDFYGPVFGWVVDPLPMGTDYPIWMLRLPGYGEFLRQHDPELFAGAGPELDPFADAVALLDGHLSAGMSAAHWTITFAVADADAAYAKALELGATSVEAPYDTQYTRQSLVEDPQGARLYLSEYRPPAE